MNNKEIIIIVAIALIILIGITYVFWKEPNYSNSNAAFGRLAVKCVPDCTSDEVCIKGACVKKDLSISFN